MSELRCPDCKNLLQVLFVERGGGKPDVKLDRCPACAGLWFEAGELEAALAKAVPHDALGAPTDRRCPYCTTTMETVLLPGAVPVETCSSCRGVWLDAGELEELGGREPRRKQRGSTPAGPTPAPSAPTRRATVAAAAILGAGVSGADFDGGLEFGEEDGDFDEDERAAPEVNAGFECASCRQRTPFSDAHGTAKGLVCGRCTPQVADMPAVPDVQLTRRSWSSRYRVSIVNLAEVLKYFF